MPGSDPNIQRLRLLERMLQLPTRHLDAVERFLASLPASREGPAPESRPALPPDRAWPHGPTHHLSEAGTYIVTAATHEKAHIFRGAERLDYLERELFAQAKGGGWQLEAWAVFSNHYHFIAHSRPESTLLSDLLRELHRTTACHVNDLDRATGRQVWFQFWDTKLTYEASYLARLKYVHHNAVKHGLVSVANQYRWCSANWFERTATPAQVKTIYRMKTDRVHLEDDFEPV